MKAPLLFLSSLLFLLYANADIIPLQSSLTTTSSTSTATPTSTSPTSTKASTSGSTTATSATSSSTTTTTSTTSSTTSGTSTTSSSTALQTSVVTSVDGTAIVTVPGSASSTLPPPQPSPTDAPTNSGGLSTGSIIGLSVAGGVAVIGLIAFFIWKLTRKRFSDFDDGEAIKWPDLNTHGGTTIDSHPLPVHNTGRAGFDTGSESSLSRVNSNNYSTNDFHSNAASDPYAVPPLPHLNPNQPYRDDPGAIGGAYYDPYRGPIPGTIEQRTGQEWSGEAIPMTQMNPGGRMSPSPNLAYTDPVAGRLSPGPQIAYGGRVSPAPQAGYAGRTSPGPQAAYGAPVSPVPPAVYDAYGSR